MNSTKLRHIGNSGEVFMSLASGKFSAVSGVALFLVSACGVVYTAPSVDEQAAGLSVQVVELTYSSVQRANRQPYNPKTLPPYFYQSAGTGGGEATIEPSPNVPFIPSVEPRFVDITPPPAVDRGAYVIGVGDGLTLATRAGVAVESQFAGVVSSQNQQQYTVRDNGTIAIADVGTVSVAGLTISQAEEQLYNAFVRNRLDPSFSLQVSDFGSQRLVVGGSVRNDIILPLGLRNVTLGEAIAAAGGVTIRDKEFGVIRVYREGSIYEIPLQEYVSKTKYQRLTLANGDAIFVDSSYDLDRALTFYKQNIEIISLRSESREQAWNALLSEASLKRDELKEKRDNFVAREELGANQRDYVYVTGEVEAQARYEMPYNVQITLADVLYDSGGFPTTTGDASEIYVLRSANSNNALTAWHLDASNAANLVLATQMKMQPNDIIFIEEQVITTWSRALAQTLPTLINVGASSIVR